ncbi:hypothetical protein [Lysinibacillus xylanilyticus]|uniref:hypothetical protein n=1 Tax=Lysinibacillus xylanilyticus TaxID=582475 RepID=UPI0036DAAE94
MNAILITFSVGVQTPTEIIEELSLRTPRPVAIYLCESAATAIGVLSVRKRSGSNNTQLSDQHHAADATLALRFRAKNICWPKASGGYTDF